MALVTVATVGCFTCLKKLGESNLMEEIHEGVFFCGVCKNVKQLDNRMALHPMGILSLSSLPALSVVSTTFLYLINNLPIALQIGMGGLIFVGYIRIGLRGLSR